MKPFFLAMMLALQFPAVAGPRLPAPFTAEQVQQWQQDLSVFGEQLQARHIDLYHRISSQRFHAQLNQLMARLPLMNRYQLMVGLKRLARQVGDGHTIAGPWANDMYRFPVRFKRFADNKVYLIASGATAKPLLGMELVSIDGTAIGQALVLAAGIAPTGSANVHAERGASAGVFNKSDLLFGLGLLHHLDRVIYTLKDSAGKRHRLALTALANSPYQQAMRYRLRHAQHYGFTPVYQAMPGLSLAVNPALKAAYIDFSRYPKDLPGMLQFAGQVRQAINQQQLRRLVIDLRHNGGGDFFLGLALASQLITLDQLDWRHGIYVLISNATFSAGASNAIQFRQILNAKLVGQATAGNPNGYQEASVFYLPNSHWPVQYSKRLYRFTMAKTAGVQPDKAIAMPWPAYRQGKDPQLAWVLKDMAQH
ncbi:hypothetical protein [Gallaecimonas sp. GXIMD1310]|uniref:hypothetical protein n=1 Tax=Gallaecimonas sp. GXIMD1310 TaxID=3131926 RepID=UPI00324A7130